MDPDKDPTDIEWELTLACGHYIITHVFPLSERFYCAECKTWERLKVARNQNPTDVLSADD